jgi:hypothetical protein
MKKVWLSSLVKAEDVVKKFIGQLKPYGLAANGHFWEDDLDKMAWIGPREELLTADTSLWVILGSTDDFRESSVRYGLSLLATTLQAQKGQAFPIFVLLTEGSLEPEALPTSLRNAKLLALSDPGLGAKLVAMAHRPTTESRSEYRLDVYGNTQIGQWFEVGPREGAWSGAMFGISEGDIIFQAVGPKGNLPSQSTLNYPMKGLKITLGDREFTAWAVKNQIEPASSYFVKVKGHPERVLFGAFSDEDQTDVFVVDLK